MSYFEQQIRQGLKARPPVASFIGRLRQNFALKSIALISSILLYVYVQAERHPMTPRAFSASVNLLDAPPDVQPERQAIPVSITGPPELLDRLTDPDIRATFSLKDAVRDSTKWQVAHGHFEIVGMGSQTTDKLIFEPVDPTLRYQVFTTVTRTVPVRVFYPKEPASNFDYGTPILTPSQVEISGHADKVNSVVYVALDATHTDGAIDRDFPVTPRDKTDAPVEGVTIDKKTVHLRVALTAKTVSKIVMVSVLPASLPTPPYFLTSLVPTPAQVQVIGRPEAIASVSTVQTEMLPFADATQSQDLTAPLIEPVMYEIRDLEGHPIKSVKIHAEIQKQAPTKPPTTDNTNLPGEDKKSKTELKPNGNP